MTVHLRKTTMRAALGSAVLVAAALAGTGCGTDESAVAPDPAVTASPQTDAEASDVAGPVTQEQAEQAALAAVGDGRVTWSGPEDDRGAAWEVEITRDDGSEIDVLVDASGNVIP
jgi:uncharacterized membrane protein YkoI